MIAIDRQGMRRRRCLLFVAAKPFSQERWLPRSCESAPKYMSFEMVKGVTVLA
jgi:hypothetical protein